MDPNLFECEEVRIGNWRSRLPSEVCTNRQIFDEIFSLDTWNKILNKDQQEKIMKMLPEELSCNPEAARQTIEELLSGNLTLFSLNPLNNFFDQLEKGQYDPVVIDTKLNIMREWKKESLRQLKSYHAKLLEDIVVSRQKHLHRMKIKSPVSSTLMRKRPKSKIDRDFGSIPQNANSLTFGADCPKKNVNTVKKTDKPVNSIGGVFCKKRKLKDDDFIDSGQPVVKKPTNVIAQHNEKQLVVSDASESPNKFIDDRSVPPETLMPMITSISNNISASTSISTSQKPNRTLATTTTITTTTTDSSIVMQAPKGSSLSFTPISKNSYDCGIHNLINTNSTISLDQQCRSVLEKKLNDFSQVLKPTSFTSPAQNSPILASQLQASPQISVKVEDSLGMFQESDACRITLNYQSKSEDKSSDDDLETSSDEFEAIQPTIGFGSTTVPSSTVSGILTTPGKVNLTYTNTLSSSSTTYQKTFNNKPIQVQDNNFVLSKDKPTLTQPVFVVSKGFSTLTNSIRPTSLTEKTPETQMLQLHGNQIKQQDTLTIPIAHLDLAMTNCQNQKRIGNQTSLDLNINSETKRSHSASEILIKDDISASLRQQFIATTHSTDDCDKVRKVQQIHSKSLEKPLESSINTEKCSTSTLSQTISDQLPNCITTTTASKGLILKSVSQLSVIPATTTTSVHPPLNMQFVASQLKIEENRMSEDNSSNLLDNNDSLNLGGMSSLGGMGLGMNINIGGLEGMVDTISNSDHTMAMKLEMDVIDKIDDLSVLDGNPFDSIPNLSDELDGLDLDLVDGLCDFDGLLSDEKKYPSFFSLIRDVLCSTRDHRMNLMCLEKTIRKWTTSPGAALNGWFLRVSDWNNALVTALNFLAGNYQDVHPEDFVPYIEYKYKTKYYQWIGAGRDGDNNLTPLCSMWMDNLDRLPSVKKLDGEVEDQEEDDEENEDSELTGEEAKKKHKRPLTPPPPRCITDWSVRPSTDDEKMQFRKQERSRFENPHKAFTYTMHGYESVVGPVKGVYSSQVGMTNKARGHSLLVDDRPPYVTILALVRDAVARLPNGEGTRSEICEMLKDSAFLAPDASSVTLNSVVSGALDRLHYERDPCVRYDSHKKSWIYLHRDRTQEQFERLHHNRSYTKSTKSRNNTARKSRRGVSKVQTEGPLSGESSTNPPPAAVVGTLITCTTTSSTPTLVTAGDEGKLPLLTSTPTNSTSFARVSISGINDTLTKGTSVCLNDSLKTCIDLTNLENEGTPSPATASLPVKTIRLTNLPDNLNGPSHQDEVSSTTTGTVQSGLPSQFIVQTSGGPFCSVQSHSSIPLHNSKPTLQLQNLCTTAESLTTNSPAITPGQILLGPSTVLRLASALRCHLRLPGAVGNINNTTMRLPQHRILLTRGSVPGTQTHQGVLLGQTSTGQTVILSTAPSNTMCGFQMQQHPTLTTGKLNDGSPCTIRLPDSEMKQTVPTFSLRPMNPMTLENSHTVTIGSGGTATMAIPKSTMTTISQGSILDTNSSKLLHLNITGASSLLNKMPIVSSPSSTVLTVPATQVITSSSSPSFQRQTMGYAVASVRGSRFSIPSTTTPMTGTIQLQTFAQSAGPQSHNYVATTTNQPDNDANLNQSHHNPITSPIIIRSAQGEFMIPGHISLGRGMQGIKLIPLPGGNKAVLAKLISPAPRMSTSTTTSTNPTSLGLSLSSSTTTTTTSSACPAQRLP